jgi:tetratricopeptide (TPR) repeat protein
MLSLMRGWAAMSSDMTAEPAGAALREAFRLNDLGWERAEAGDWDAALGLYQQAIDLTPAYSPVLYNMGLIYKWRRQWADCVDCNDRAARYLHEDEGRDCHVFDEIEIWKPSGVPTLSVEVTASDPADSQALEETFVKAGLGAEDWTKEIRFLCKQCSEGTQSDGHDHPPATYTADRRFGLAAPVEVARQLLVAWAAARPGTRAHGDPVLAEA